MNAATNALAPLTWPDLDGHSRRHESTVDIGADELPIGTAWHPILSPSPNLARLTLTNVGGITYAQLDVALPDTCHELVGVIAPEFANREVTATANLMVCEPAACLPVVQASQWTKVLSNLPPGLVVGRLISWDTTVEALRWTPPQPGGRTLTDLSLSPSGFPQFTVQGVANVDYIVETSTNLVSWMQVYTNRGAPFTFSAPSVPSPEPTFYRALVRNLP